MEMTTADFQCVLEQLKPEIGNYEWLWKILRFRARQRGGFPFRLHSTLKRLGNARKPLFIGKTCDGVDFLGDYRDGYAATWAACPQFDSSLLTFLKANVRDMEGAYLDVGTNIGVVAATIARHGGESLPVVAFEPVPFLSRCAAATFALNGLRNVRLFQSAVSDHSGEICFYVAEGYTGLSTAHCMDMGFIRWSQTSVCCNRLDDLVAEAHIGPVGFMKVDVEGHELQALRGARRTIARDRPGILCEYLSQRAESIGWTLQDLQDVLDLESDHQYQYKILHEDGKLTDFPPPNQRSRHIDLFCKAAKKRAAPISRRRSAMQQLAGTYSR
jgi:FkbM family methyltransferase